jgi:hypothetical protein
VDNFLGQEELSSILRKVACGNFAVTVTIQSSQDVNGAFS